MQEGPTWLPNLIGVIMATKREWLVSQGLAKPGRGRFSKAAVDALAAAEASGTVFDEPTTTVPAAETDAVEPATV